MKRQSERMFVIAACIAVLTITFRPLFHEGLIAGHDTGYHISRIEMMTKALRDGQFPVRWVEGPVEGLSHPLFEFYPPLLYYPTGFLGLAGVAPRDALCFTIVASGAIGWLAMFFLFKKLTDTFGGITGAVLFLVTPYRFSQLYVRAAFPEYLATNFIPLVFLGIMLVFAGKKRIGILFSALAGFGIVTSHEPTAVMIAFPVVLWVVFLWLKTRDNRRLAGVAAGLVAGLGLSAFLLIPILFEQGFIRLGLLTSDYFSYAQHFAQFGQLLWSPWGYGLSVPGPNDAMSFQVGIVNWIVIIAAAGLAFYYYYKQHNHYTGYILLFLVIAIYGIFMSTAASQVLWVRFPFFQFIQYPWRFLAVVSMGTAGLASFLVGSVLYLLPREKYGKIEIACLLCGAAIIFSWSYVTPGTYLNRDAFLTKNLDVRTIIERQGPLFGVESSYFPKWVTRVRSTPIQHKFEVIGGKALLTDLIHHTTFQQIKVDVPEEATLRVYTHYFPGWYVTMDTGLVEQAVPVKIDNPEGFMDIALPTGSYTVTLRYKKTPVQQVADFTSLMTILALLLFAV